MSIFCSTHFLSLSGIGYWGRKLGSCRREFLTKESHKSETILPHRALSITCLHIHILIKNHWHSVSGLSPRFVKCHSALGPALRACPPTSRNSCSACDRRTARWAGASRSQGIQKHCFYASNELNCSFPSSFVETLTEALKTLKVCSIMTWLICIKKSWSLTVSCKHKVEETEKNIFPCDENSQVLLCQQPSHITHSRADYICHTVCHTASTDSSG